MGGNIHVDVEPLGDSQWSKIERSLDDRLARDPMLGATAVPAYGAVANDSSRWRGVGWFVLAGAAAAAIGVLVTQTGSRHDTVMSSRLETTDVGTRLVIGESSLDVAPHTALRVRTSDGGVTVLVEHGSVQVTKGNDVQVTKANDVPPAASISSAGSRTPPDPDSPEAQARALYDAALADLNRGSVDEASHALVDYSMRFPHGADAARVRDLLDRLLRGDVPAPSSTRDH